MNSAVLARPLVRLVILPAIAQIGLVLAPGCSNSRDFESSMKLATAGSDPIAPAMQPAADARSQHPNASSPPASNAIAPGAMSSGPGLVSPALDAGGVQPDANVEGSDSDAGGSDSDASSASGNGTGSPSIADAALPLDAAPPVNSTQLDAAAPTQPMTGLRVDSPEFLACFTQFILCCAVQRADLCAETAERTGCFPIGASQCVDENTQCLMRNPSATVPCSQQTQRCLCDRVPGYPAAGCP